MWRDYSGRKGRKGVVMRGEEETYGNEEDVWLRSFGGNTKRKGQIERLAARER